MDRASTPILFWRHSEGVCRVGTSLIGAFLFAAAISKTLFPTETMAALGHLTGLFGGGPSLVFPALIALLVIEILIGSALVFGLWPHASVPAALTLLVGFSAWSLFLMVSRADIPCGCGLRIPWGVELSGRPRF
jgi:hypothetical protein